MRNCQKFCGSLESHAFANGKAQLLAQRVKQKSTVNRDSCKKIRKNNVKMSIFKRTTSFTNFTKTNFSQQIQT